MSFPLFNTPNDEPVGERVPALSLVSLVALLCVASPLGLAPLTVASIAALLVITWRLPPSEMGLLLSAWELGGVGLLLLGGSVELATLYLFALRAAIPRSRGPRALTFLLLLFMGLFAQAPPLFFVALVGATAINLDRFIRWRAHQETLFLLNAQSRALERLRYRHTSAVDPRADMIKRPLFSKHKHYAMMGRIIAGFSHDIGPALTQSRALIDEMNETPSPLTRSFARVEHFIHALTRISRPPSVDTASSLFLSHFIETLESTLKEALPANTDLLIDPPPEVWLQAHPDHLRDALVLLIGDTWKTVIPGDNQALFLRALPLDRHLQITLDFQGSDFQQVNLDHLFEPYYTAKKDGFGAGLGLALARSYLLGMDGQLACNHRPEHGLRLTLLLRLSQRTKTPKRVPEKIDALSTGRPRLVILDMASEQRQTLLDGFENHWTVLLATTADEAIRLLEEHTVQFLMADLTLLSTENISVLDAVIALQPDLLQRTLLFAQPQSSDPLIALNPKRIIHKPYAIRGVRRQMLQLLDASPAPFKLPPILS